MRFLAAASALLFLAAQPMSVKPQTVTFHRHFAPADRDTGRYQYVPFGVAAGIESLTIAYRYSGEAQGASTIDLGLFEPGPLTLGASSLRGYSGGAQRTITVGRSSASPGYRTGPLPSGTWHVLLGLYKVAPDGVDVDIDIAASPERRQSVDDPTRDRGVETAAPPASVTGRRWYSGGLHLHTNHSDGTIGPAAVAAAAAEAGLDFISITDHNNTTWTRELMPAAPLAIVGEEVTTPAGHADVWGLSRGTWIDFRVTPTEPDAADRINDLVAAAHHAGALFSLNHPFGECGGCAWQQVIPDAIDALEIWNGERGPQREAVALWDRLLASGHRVTAVGASDWHRWPAPIGAAAVRVLADALTQPALTDSLRHGRAIVMRDARTAPPVVSARCGPRSAAIGDTLRCAPAETVAVRVEMAQSDEVRAELVVNGEPRRMERVGSGVVLTAPAATGYLRVHVYDAEGGTVAITNPIYVAAR